MNDRNSLPEHSTRSGAKSPEVAVSAPASGESKAPGIKADSRNSNLRKMNKAGGMGDDFRIPKEESLFSRVPKTD
jgi:hypothetical protein